MTDLREVDRDVATAVVHGFLTNELRQISRLREEELKGDANPQVDQDLLLVHMYLQTRLDRLQTIGLESAPEPT